MSSEAILQHRRPVPHRPIALALALLWMGLAAVTLLGCSNGTTKPPHEAAAPQGLALELTPSPAAPHQRFTATVHDHKDRDGSSAGHAALDKWTGSGWKPVGYVMMNAEAQTRDDHPGGIVLDDIGIPFEQPIDFRLPAHLDDGYYRIQLDAGLPPVPASNEAAGRTELHLERIITIDT